MDSCLFLSKIAHLAELITKLEASIAKVAINKKTFYKEIGVAGLKLSIIKRGNKKSLGLN